MGLIGRNNLFYPFRKTNEENNRKEREEIESEENEEIEGDRKGKRLDFEMMD